MKNEEAAKILKNEYMCRIKINSCNISGKTCVGCECYEDKDTVTQAINYAVQALSKQSASCGQADYKAQVKILADVLDSCPLTEPCDWMWRPTGWCKDHCKDGQDSPDAECWLEYARVMAESKTESDHIADSDKMVDQFRGITKKTDDVPDTNVGKTDFKPGDKFILELGQERKMFDEFEIAGTDLYVETRLLEKLTRYEPEEKAEKIPYKKPEIIRCKDCQYRDPEDKKCDHGHGIVWQLPRPDDWFCADGKA